MYSQFFVRSFDRFKFDPIDFDNFRTFEKY